MRWLGVVVMIAMVACEPEPGETRCSSTMIYGSTFMRCRTTPPDEQRVPVAAQPEGFWCTTGADGFGVCAQGDRGAGVCEMTRPKLAAAMEISFGPCTFSAIAICAPTGCFTTPGACAAIERQAGRDGSACAVRR